MSSHLQALAEHRRRADECVAMNLPVANEFSLFEAGNPEVVEDVNRTANIPFTRVVEALDLTPQ